jgi:hypothetical protein
LKTFFKNTENYVKIKQKFLLEMNVVPCANKQAINGDINGKKITIALLIAVDGSDDSFASANH